MYEHSQTSRNKQNKVFQKGKEMRNYVLIVFTLPFLVTEIQPSRVITLAKTWAPFHEIFIQSERRRYDVDFSKDTQG